MESALSQAREHPEGAAAPQPRRQAKSRSSAQVATATEKKIEAALARARKLDSEGKDAACVATLAKLPLPDAAN